jgi:hypothetical protein
MAVPVVMHSAVMPNPGFVSTASTAPTRSSYQESRGDEGLLRNQVHVRGRRHRRTARIRSVVTTVHRLSGVVSRGCRRSGRALCHRTTGGQSAGPRAGRSAIASPRDSATDGGPPAARAARAGIPRSRRGKGIWRRERRFRIRRAKCGDEPRRASGQARMCFVDPIPREVCRRPAPARRGARRLRRAIGAMSPTTIETRSPESAATSAAIRGL